MVHGEEVAFQHQLLMCDINQVQIHSRPKVWKLRDYQTCSRFQEVFKTYVSTVETKAAAKIDEIWKSYIQVC